MRRYALPDGPYGMAIDNRRHRMFVTQVGRNRLWVLNVGARLTRLGLHATPRRPDAVAVDERTGRVYVQRTGGWRPSGPRPHRVEHARSRRRAAR